MHLTALAGSIRGSELFDGTGSHCGSVPWSLGVSATIADGPCSHLSRRAQPLPIASQPQGLLPTATLLCMEWVLLEACHPTKEEGPE